MAKAKKACASLLKEGAVAALRKRGHVDNAIARLKQKDLANPRTELPPELAAADFDPRDVLRALGRKNGDISASDAAHVQVEWAGYLRHRNGTGIHGLSVEHKDCPYSYWQSKAMEWPVLAPVMLIAIVAPVSNVAPETVFSLAHHISSATDRSCIGDESLKNELYIKFNRSLVELIVMDALVKARRAEGGAGPGGM